MCPHLLRILIANGHRARVAHCAMFREHWADVGGKTAFDASELDAAEVLAEQLIACMNAHKQPTPQLAAAAEQRRRAFTLLASAHDEARRAISFLRWKQEDVESIAPSLYAGRKGRIKTA
jgi:hypothetical protein